MMRVDHNANVTSGDPAGIPEVWVEEISVVLELTGFQLVCKRIASSYNLIFTVFSGVMIGVIFAIRWGCFVHSYERLANTLELASIGTMTAMETVILESVWKQAYLFGSYLFITEVILTGGVYTYIFLVYRYIVEKVWNVIISFGDDTSLIISTCGAFILQCIFFEVHEFAFTNFVKLGGQTRMTIYYFDLMNQIGDKFMEVAGGQDEAMFVAHLRAKAQIVNSTLTAGIFTHY